MPFDIKPSIPKPAIPYNSGLIVSLLNPAAANSMARKIAVQHGAPIAKSCARIRDSTTGFLRLSISGRAGRLSNRRQDNLCQLLDNLRIDERIVRKALGNGKRLVDRTKGLAIFDIAHLQQRWNPRLYLFPKLPAELRISIWQLSLPKKRVLALTKRPTHHLIYDGHRFDTTEYLAPYNSIPTALSVCRESRSEALRFYKRAFGEWCQDGKTYFDCNFDTLYVGNDKAINFAELVYFLSGGQGINSLVSIALSTSICVNLASALKTIYKNRDVAKIASKNLTNLREAYCISSQDPDIVVNDFKISECACGSVGSLETSQIEFIEKFLGTKLTCGEIAR